MDKNVQVDAILARCPKCGGTGFYAKEGPKTCKVCGHTEG